MATLCEYYPDSLTTIPSSAPQAEKDRLAAQNKSREELYVVVRHILSKRFAFALDMTNPAKPVWRTPPNPAGMATTPSNRLTDAEKAQFNALYGILLVDGFAYPMLGKSDVGADDLNEQDDQGRGIRAVRHFVNAVVSAEQEYTATPDLYQRVFAELRNEGTSLPDPNTGDSTATIYARQVALVTRRLVEQGVMPNDPQIRHRILDALSAYLGGGGDASWTDVDLPDLEDSTVAEVVADNVRALSAVYFASMLEELKYFAVADKLAEHFMSGMLPLSRGPGGESIYDYIRAAPQRLSEHERRSLYARTFGFAQGGVDEPLPNREFGDLWIRFLSSVSLGNRQTTYERAVVTPEQVFKAGKDLAVNLSLHGYGLPHFAAIELQRLTKQLKAMFTYPDVLSGYGARDWGQLVERISSLYLGGSVNGVRQRTMATTGATIIQWVADNAAILSMPSGSIDVSDAKLQLDPKLKSLVQNVERWLAVTGTNDSSVEKYSEPVALPTQPTIPNFPPQLSMNGLNGASNPALRDAFNRIAGMNPLAGQPKPPAQA